jgi:hypothetical protein
MERRIRRRNRQGLRRCCLQLRSRLEETRENEVGNQGASVGAWYSPPPRSVSAIKTAAVPTRQESAMSTKEVSKNEETKTTSVADPDMKRNSGAGRDEPKWRTFRSRSLVMDASVRKKSST